MQYMVVNILKSNVFFAMRDKPSDNSDLLGHDHE